MPHTNKYPDLPTIQDYALEVLQDYNSKKNAPYVAPSKVLPWLIYQDLSTYSPGHPSIAAYFHAENTNRLPEHDIVSHIKAHEIWEDYQALVIKYTNEYFEPTQLCKDNGSISPTMERFLSALIDSQEDSDSDYLIITTDS